MTMPFPAEQGLVKYFVKELAAGSTDPITYSYSLPGGLPTTNIDLSSQIQGQGVAVFVDNPSDVNFKVDVYSTIRIYGEDFRVYLGSFAVELGSEGGMAVGFGLVKRGLEVVVTPDNAPTETVEVTVAIVPTNG